MTETSLPNTFPTSSKSSDRLVSQWRSHPGYLSAGGSEFESIHILLGRFLGDRHSPNPLAERSVLDQNSAFAWGQGQPLEKVIDSAEALDALLVQPQLFRNAIAIIEPWEHVGHNPLGEPVRASLNAAYITQKIADCDSVLFPLWASGLPKLQKLVPLISSGIAIIVEGGNSSVRDAPSFDSANCSHHELLLLTEEILLARSPASAPALFICLGHQLAAQAHIRLIRRAAKEILETEVLSQDKNDQALHTLQRVASQIQSVGQSLQIRKRNGHIVANGWTDAEFAVAENEAKEVGDRQLLGYESPSRESGIPEELVAAHEVTADEHEGVIDTSIKYEHELNIAMFHSDEVNEEAILFANWAYRLIHDALIPCRHIVANSPLSWLIRLPDAVEILCSTAEEGEIVTECSATCINYKDFETKKVRRSFTCQFHPELLSDLRAIGKRQPPSYAELKQDDGARLFARLLYAGMQE